MFFKFQPLCAPATNEPEEKPEYPGYKQLKFVHNLEMLNPDLIPGIPVYRVMDRKGHIVESEKGNEDPNVSISRLIQ